MDNAQKAIMIGVGLFITIIIISAVLLIVNLGTGLVDDATAELGTMSTSLQNQILQSYDNKVLSGVQVRSAIQQYIRSTDLTVVLCSIDEDSKVAAAAMVGAEDFAPSTILLEDTTTSLVGSLETAVEGVEGFEIPATDYTTAGAGNLKQTSMAEFNKIGNAGGMYINTASNYKSVILRVQNTDTVVGIIFIPYEN